MGSVIFSDVGLSNWAAGGNSQSTLIGNLSLFANRKWGSSFWENNLDLAYGFLKVRKQPIAKAEDKIDFNSKYGRKAWSDKVYYAGLVNFRTQSDFGRQVPGDSVYISRFMSPAYLNFALGIDIKPNEDLSLFIGPASGKFTYVSDDSLAALRGYGVNQVVDPFDPESDFLPGNRFNSRIEIGATFRAQYKKSFSDKIGFQTNLELFSNYFDRPQNIDVRWTTAFIAKITKYITVNLNTELIYDHDINIPQFDDDNNPIYSINPEGMLFPGNPIPVPNSIYWPGPGYIDGSNPFDVSTVQRAGPRLQFKRVFGIGLTYKF